MKLLFFKTISFPEYSHIFDFEKIPEPLLSLPTTVYTVSVTVKDPAATYDFNITDEMEAVESDFAGNKETVAKDTNYAPYTLQSHNDGVAFKLFTGTNITGFKAYLNLTPTSDAEAKAVGIRFADDTTGIEDTELDVQDAEPIYDLMGRRVEKMVKGNMYIVNGKKVVI